MRSTRTALLLAAATLLLAGCSATPTTDGDAPSDLPTAPPTVSLPPISEPPVETESPPAGLFEDLPGDDEEPTTAPAPVWSAEDVLGACKNAWIEGAEGIDWGRYDFDPEDVRDLGDGSHYAEFHAEAEGDAPADTRSCLVSGDPAAPVVVLNPELG